MNTILEGYVKYRDGKKVTLFYFQIQSSSLVEEALLHFVFAIEKS